MLKAFIGLFKKIKGIILYLSCNYGSNVKTTNYYSYKLTYSKGTSIVMRYFNSGVYEPELCDLVIKDINSYDNPIFMDVGANIGLISLNLLSRARKIDKIYAIEPGQHQFSLFRKTISDNHLQNMIDLERVALCDKNSNINFSIHDTKDASGDGILDTGRAGNSKTVKVRSMTLDYWWKIKKKPKINVIKIDTEGAELLILKHAIKVIKSLKPTVYFEMWPEFTKLYGYVCDDLVDYGYKVFTIYGKLLTKKNRKRFYGKEANFVAYEKDKKITNLFTKLS